MVEIETPNPLENPAYEALVTTQIEVIFQFDTFHHLYNNLEIVVTLLSVVLQVLTISNLLKFGNMSVDDFFSSLNLELICLADPLIELELEVAPMLKESKL